MRRLFKFIPERVRASPAYQRFQASRLYTWIDSFTLTLPLVTFVLVLITALALSSLVVISIPFFFQGSGIEIEQLALVTPPITGYCPGDYIVWRYHLHLPIYTKQHPPRLFVSTEIVDPATNDPLADGYVVPFPAATGQDTDIAVSMQIPSATNARVPFRPGNYEVSYDLGLVTKRIVEERRIPFTIREGCAQTQFNAR